MAGIFDHVSLLPNLQALAITCFNAAQFTSVAALPTVRALTVEFGNDRAELEALQTLAGLSRVRQLQLQARKQVRAVNFGQGVLNAWQVTEGLKLHFYMTTKNEEAAMKAAAKMVHVKAVMIQDISEPCSLRCLNGLPSPCWLMLVCAVGNELLQQVSRIRSLQFLVIYVYHGNSAGLLWVKHMPNLRLIQFGRAVDAAVLGVLPKRLLKGIPPVRDEDE